jgi:hypothetical protein
MAKKLTHNEWYEKYKNMINDSIEILGTYINMKTKILVRCRSCLKEYKTLPSVIINGCKCKSCSTRKNNDVFIKELENVDNTIIPLENYKGDSNPILMRCKICDTEWRARPTHLIRGHGCPSCGIEKRAIKRRTPQLEFEKELSIKNQSIICIGKYINRFTPILVSSTICKHIWKAAPSNLLFNKTGCPICFMSHGEREIYLFLENNTVDFICQKEFDCLIGVNGGNLSYDFYLPTYNILIEYQGEFHDGTAKQQTDEELKIQQEHDIRKKEYAKEHNIKLLEIWYWDFHNIEEILSKEFGFNPNSYFIA